MEKKEQLLLIEPQHELKFVGKSWAIRCPEIAFFSVYEIVRLPVSPLLLRRSHRQC